MRTVFHLSNSAMTPQPVVSLNASGGDLTRLVVEHRRLLQSYRTREDEAYFVDYTPPARDAIVLPRNVVYVLVGVVLVIVATYAIVGHLIKDLMHDLADWFLGPKPVEDDLEDGLTNKDEERRPSISSSLMERDRPRMEKERDSLLPGFHWAESACRRPSTPPPLPIASSCLGENRTSAQTVTFACPVTIYATSL